MGKKRIILGTISLLLAVVFGAGQYLYLSQEFTEEKTAVYLAARDIAAGEQITDDDFTLKEIPASAYTKEMVAGIGEGAFYAAVKIPKGGYLLSSMATKRILPALTEGQVKVTIRVDLYSALAGKILPGDKVNVGFVPGSSGEGKVYLPGMIAQDLLITDVTNEKGKEINGTKSSNEYADEVMLPAAVTLVCETEDQSVLLKEHEKAGSLFLTSGQIEGE